MKWICQVCVAMSFINLDKIYLSNHFVRLLYELSVHLIQYFDTYYI